MPFESRAFTTEGVLADMHRQMTLSLGRRGLINPASGVTQPLSGNYRSAKDILDSLDQSISARRGEVGRGADLNRLDVNDTYRARRFEWFKREEGSRTMAYDDATGRWVTAAPVRGNRTVGIGFNLDRPGARDTFRQLFGSAVNFDRVYNGRAQLTQAQIRTLFDHTVSEAEGLIDRTFRGTALTEHQRLALVSMAFNSPALIGPKITAAIKAGDWQAATNEILFHSNGRYGAGVDPNGGEAYRSPIQGDARISSRFGRRTDPITGRAGAGHGGMDYAVPIGTPVMAAAGGRVVRAERSASYGNVIYIDHPDGHQTRYAHLDSIGVRVGQTVAAGALIGKSGNTGERTTGPHLHFEVRKGSGNNNSSTPVDPEPFFTRAPAAQPTGHNPFAGRRHREATLFVSGASGVTVPDINTYMARWR